MNYPTALNSLTGFGTSLSKCPSLPGGLTWISPYRELGQHRTKDALGKVELHVRFELTRPFRIQVYKTSAIGQLCE